MVTRNAIAFLTSLLVVAFVMIATARALSCPRIPSQPGDPSLLNLAGFRLFIDPSLDPELSEWRRSRCSWLAISPTLRLPLQVAACLSQ